MGYDVTRFQGEVDEDLLCPICSGVLEEPVQVRLCFKRQPISNIFTQLPYLGEFL